MLSLVRKQFKYYYFYRKLIEYEREHSESQDDIPAYLSNPINAYLLTKRLTSDWKEIEKLMSFDVGSRKFISFKTN